MKNKYLLLAILFIGIHNHSIAQSQAFYDVSGAQGNGIRFWSNDLYKIHMGNYPASEYFYGPVQGYSIKMNMSSQADRGWTWGISGQTPIAALSNTGIFQIANNFYSLGNVGIGTTSPLNPLHISKVGSDDGGFASANEVVAHFTSTSNHSAISVDAISGQDPIVYFAENGDAMWDIRSDQSNSDKFQIRWQNQVGTNATRLTIDNTGDVGIGTTSPAYKLDVNGSGRYTGSVQFETPQSIGLEKVGTYGARHWITYNDGGGNFNLRVGNKYVSGAHTITESGHAFHTIWSQNPGIITWKISQNGAPGTIASFRELFRIDYDDGFVANYGGASTLDFRVEGNNDSHLIFADASSDRVGIGTTTPLSKFHLKQSTEKGLMFERAGHDSYELRLAASKGLHVLNSSSGEFEMSFHNGSVGIGTSSPDEKLTVKGKIHAEEVRVDLSVPGPDYVFEEQYNLPTLQSIEKFIRSNKHLPEIPPAKEMEENGLELGTMNMLLLKKIEELTLYTIKQSKAIDELQALNKEFKARLANLENQ